MTDRNELIEVVSCVSGNRSRGTNWKIEMIKRYVKWCPNSTEGVIDILNGIGAKDINIAYMKNHMASDPEDFNGYLNSFLRPDDLLTIDITYKCVLWLGYAGFPEEEILKLRSPNVGLDVFDGVFTIAYKGKDYFVPEIAVDVFKKCVQLKAFSYSNPNYTKGDIMRDRMTGDILLRGVRSTSKSYMVLTQNIAKRVQVAGLERRINYSNAALSGFFYHLYSIEKNNEIDFMFYARNYVSRREYKLDKSNLTLAGLQAKIARELEFDYNLWKLAFKK
jgi:hypothetical protein